MMNDYHCACGAKWQAEGIQDMPCPTCNPPSKLNEIVDEYLHWRKVNPHIKGGENYLKRLSAAVTKAKVGEIARCPVCHWPLAKTVAEGCVIGNCSYREKGKG